jgi:filamentous hemagglutinin family protein
MNMRRRPRPGAALYYTTPGYWRGIMYSCNDLKCTSALASILFLAATGSYAAGLPDHGHYVAGQGSITKANQSLTVKQSSTAGIIDWDNFSIGKHNGVTFDNGSGATLNRVTGGNLSKIAGALHATGSLFLMNSAGVIVSRSGHVVTGGSFAAMSGNITNTAFDDGDRRFRPGAGNVVNKGRIVSGGATFLLGHNVSDTGTIRASAADLQATHNLAIDGAITARNSDSNGGIISASARTIVIGAAGGINASASSIGRKGGTIRVVARDTTTVAGSLTAQGGSQGGFVETSGEHLHVADSAKISTLATNGNTGTWLIDPQDFTIAASGGDITGSALSAELASNDVDIQSKAGANAGVGDINVDDAVTWASSHTLTLDAYHSIHIDDAITIASKGGLVLATNDGGKGGDYDFGLGTSGFAGHVTFTDVVRGQTKGSLLINGAVYHLANSVKQLAKELEEDNQNYTEDWALANSYDAQPDGTYKTSPIYAVIEGTIEGLGNSISNLTIRDTKQVNVGLFSEIAGNIRDVGLQNETVIGGQQSSIGGLVGTAESFIQLRYDYVTGQITGGQESDVGGLVGFSTAQIFDSHSSATVTGSVQGAAGGLVGVAVDGSIAQSSASGSVSGSDVSGGLVGSSEITIEHSFATGNVSAGSDVGGLVGGNDGKIIGSYALGAVLTAGEPNGYAGGLVGYSSGSVVDSFSTGPVEGPSSALGGLIGAESSSAITERSYWDTETSGTTIASADRRHLSGAKGETTAELQSDLQTGFDSSTWSIVAGASFPYLNWQFPSGAPQVVSGLVLNEYGGVPVVDASVEVAVDGLIANPALSVETATNGYYYVLLSPGSIPAKGDVFAYISDDSGAALGAGVTNNLDIFDNYLSEATNSEKFSTIKSQLARALGSNAALISVRQGLSSLAVFGDGAEFEINEKIDVKDGGSVLISTAGNLSIADEVKAAAVVLNSGAGISESDKGAIVTNVLSGASVSGASLLGESNAFKTLAGFVNSGAAGISVSDEDTLTVTGAVNSGVGDFDLNVEQPFGNHVSLNIDAALTAGGTIELYSTEIITEDATTGKLNASMLRGLAEQGISLDGKNKISKIENLSTDGGDIDFTDEEAVAVVDVESEQGNIRVKTDQGGITLKGSVAFASFFASDGSVTLDSAGMIKNDQGASIYADSVGGYSTGGAKFVGDFETVEDFTNTGGGKVVFDGAGQSDGQLTISGIVNAGSAEIYVPINATDTIAIDGTLQTTGTVDLNAPYIASGFSGKVIANELTGEAEGNGGYAHISGTIAKLGAFTVGDDFSLSDARTVTIVGAVSTADQNNTPGIYVSTTAGGIHIDASLTTYEVQFYSAGIIDQNANGLITAKYLSGQAAQDVILGQANKIGGLLGFTDSGGNITLNTSEPLSVTGEVQTSAANSTISLSTTTGGITINGSLQSSEVDLNSAGAISGGSGAIVASTLTGYSLGAADFSGSQNLIGSLGAFSTNSAGDFTLVDGETLSVSGTVNAGAHDISLTTTSGDIAIGAGLEAGTVNLTSAGQATESSSGAIAADILNVAAQTGISLTSSNNSIVTIGIDTTASGSNDITQ